MCSLHEDVSGSIDSLLRSVASTHPKILDFGCGVGGYLQFLSENFDEVTAADTSNGCVERAALVATRFSNIRVLSISALRRRRADLSFDAVLMANVLLSPESAERRKILREAVGYLRPGGNLILVVPAIESVHLTEAVRRQYRSRHRSVYSVPPVSASIDPGVIRIHGQPTKHHSCDELGFELSQAGLAVVDVARAQYSWRSEGFEGLDALLAERPWDWLVRARLDHVAVRGGRRQSSRSSAGV